MEKLSENFTREEFACKCGCGFDDVDPRLVSGLQKLRYRAGVPIHINSACRCDEHNKAVGGVPRRKDGTGGSYHLYGKAADIVITGMTPKQMAECAEHIPEFKTGAIITYLRKGFIHVDVRSYKYRETRR